MIRAVLALLKKQTGWILVDSLIGVVIITVALTALMGAYIQATKVNSFNHNYTNAVYIAKKNLEDLKQYEGTPTIKSLPSSLTNPSKTVVDNVTFTIMIEPAAISGLDSKIYPYRVTVSWTEANQSAMRSISMVSYFLSN